MRHLDVLRKMRREAEEAHRRAAEGEREERRRRAEAARRFRDIVKAEKLAKEWGLDYVELSLEDFLRTYQVKPLFRDLWELAKACTDQRACYRMLAYFKLEGRDADLQLVREAERLGVDVEVVAALLYNDKREEAIRLVKR